MNIRVINNQTFRKIFIITASCIAVPAVMIFIVFQIRHLNNARTKLVEKEYQAAKYVAVSLSNEFERFMLLSNNMVTLKWLFKLSSSYDYFFKEYSESILIRDDLIYQMKTYQALFQMPSQLGILVENRNIIVSNQSFCNADLYFAEKVKKTDELYRLIIDADAFHVYSLRQENIEPLENWLLLVSPIQVRQHNRSVLFQFVKKFDLDIYMAKISPANLGKLIIYDVYGNELYSYTNNNYSSKDEFKHSFEYDYGVQIAVTTYVDHDSWLLRTLETISELLAVFLAVLFIAYVLAKLLYMPVFNLQERITKDANVPSSVFLSLNPLAQDDQFKAIEKTYKKAINDNQNAIRALSKYQEQMKEIMLSDMLLGYETQFDKLKNFLDDLDIAFSDEDDYLVCLLSNIEDDKLASVRLGVITWFAENESHIQCVYINDCIALIFVVDNKFDKEYILKKMEGFNAQAEIDMNNPPTVSYGTVQPGYAGIAKSYDIARDDEPQDSAVTVLNAQFKPNDAQMIQLLTAVSEGDVNKVAVIARNISKDTEPSPFRRIQVQLNILKALCLMKPHADINLNSRLFYNHDFR